MDNIQKEAMKNFLIKNSHLLANNSLYPLMKSAYEQFKFDPDDLLILLNTVAKLEQREWLYITTNFRGTIVKNTHDEILKKLKDMYQLDRKYNKSNIKDLIFKNSTQSIIKWIDLAGWIDSTLKGGIITRAQRNGIEGAIDDMKNTILSIE